MTEPTVIIICPAANFYKGACANDCLRKGSTCHIVPAAYAVASLIPEEHPVNVYRRQQALRP